MPLAIAVDDLQWLDRPSVRVLKFVARRLRDEPVLLLLSCRVDLDDGPFALDGALPLRRSRVGPLSVGAGLRLDQQVPAGCPA